MDIERTPLSVADTAPSRGEMPTHRGPEHLERSRDYDAASAVVLILWLFAAVWFTQRPLPRWTSGNPDLNVYLVQPVVWSTFAVVAWRWYQRLPDAPQYSRLLTKLGLVAGVFHISVLTLSGLIVGFADNPAAGALANYPKNALYFTAVVVGVEVSRAYVFHALRPIGETVAFLVTVPVFAAIVIPLGQWVTLGSTDAVFQVGFGRYLPALTLSAVATMLVADGGILISAAYRWPLLALYWLFPVLPAHEWPLRSLLGTALPIGAYWIVRTIYEGTTEYARTVPEELVEDTEDPDRSWPRWVGTGVIVLVVVLFVNGAFGVKPYLLTGISMEPGFGRGDVVIVREVPVESLEVNDVIRFQHAGIYYIHRIIDIYEDESGLVFVTQGDNVDRPDPPVPAELVTGKAVFMIPLIGLPSLWIRESLDDR